MEEREGSLVEAQEVIFDVPEATPSPNTQTTAVARAEPVNTPAPVQSSGAMTPMQMLNAAIERGDSLDKLERLMDLNDRWERAQAQKAFLEAKAAFKAAAPTIRKDKDNKQYGSKYASIDNVVTTLNAVLAKFGLDAKWDYDQSDVKGKGIGVICIVRHTAGHAESVTLYGPPDTSGAKNPLQQIKSTLTYLRLATFEAVVGFATKEGAANDDGNSAGNGVDPLATITEEQQETIRNLIAETNSNTGIFLQVAKAETISDILAKDFDGLVKKLNMKKTKGSAA